MRLTVKFTQNLGVFYVLYEMYCRNVAVTVACLCVLQQMRQDIDELERLRDEYMQKNKEQVGLPPTAPPPHPLLHTLPFFLSLVLNLQWEPSESMR